MTDFLIKPSVNNKSLFKLKKSINEKGEKTKIPIIEEKPLTLYMNNQEIVTIMTIGDYPKYLAIGYLFNQGMLNSIEDVKKIEFHNVFVCFCFCSICCIWLLDPGGFGK